MSSVLIDRLLARWNAHSGWVEDLGAVGALVSNDPRIFDRCWTGLCALYSTREIRSCVLVVKSSDANRSQSQNVRTVDEFGVEAVDSMPSPRGPRSAATIVRDRRGRYTQNSFSIRARKRDEKGTELTVAVDARGRTAIIIAVGLVALVMVFLGALWSWR